MIESATFGRNICSRLTFDNEHTEFLTVTKIDNQWHAYHIWILRVSTYAL